MGKRRLFGTDGIRGKANVYPMTIDTAVRLGQAVALKFTHPERHGRILIGKDTRLSCYMFENAIAAGVMSMGADVLLVGPLPTPGIAHLTTSMRADAGIVISASHNPFDDNGIKIFGSDGFKLPDDVEAEIERLMQDGSLEQHYVTGRNLGRSRRIEDAQGRYLTFCKHTFPNDLTLDGMRVVVDCANGAAYRIAPLIFQELGAEVFTLGVQPNGLNINDGVGALYPERMAEAVRTYRADIGIALDGDADRVIFADEHGNVVDGDAILGLAARFLKGEGRLSQDTLVATVMSNMALDGWLANDGIRVLRTAVGDRYVLDRMLSGGYNVGGEQSGHIIFRDHTTTGDGIVAALQIIAIMLRTGKSLGELTSSYTPYPQIKINVPVAAKPPLEEIEPLQEAIRTFENELAGEGRILVRYSGTEPKARVLVECRDEIKGHEMASQLADMLKVHCI